jgi:hypothetical protein
VNQQNQALMSDEWLWCSLLVELITDFNIGVGHCPEMLGTRYHNSVGDS